MMTPNRTPAETDRESLIAAAKPLVTESWDGAGDWLHGVFLGPTTHPSALGFAVPLHNRMKFTALAYDADVDVKVLRTFLRLLPWHEIHGSLEVNGVQTACVADWLRRGQPDAANDLPTRLAVFQGVRDSDGSAAPAEAAWDLDFDNACYAAFQGSRPAVLQAIVSRETIAAAHLAKDDFQSVFLSTQPEASWIERDVHVLRAGAERIDAKVKAQEDKRRISNLDDVYGLIQGKGIKGLMEAGHNPWNLPAFGGERPDMHNPQLLLLSWDERKAVVVEPNGRLEMHTSREYLQHFLESSRADKPPTPNAAR